MKTLMFAPLFEEKLESVQVCMRNLGGEEDQNTANIFSCPSRWHLYSWSVFWRSESTKSQAEEMTGEMLRFIVTDLIDSMAVCLPSLSLPMEINSQGLVKSREFIFQNDAQQKDNNGKKIDLQTTATSSLSMG